MVPIDIPPTESSNAIESPPIETIPPDNPPIEMIPADKPPVLIIPTAQFPHRYHSFLHGADPPHINMNQRQSP